VGLRPVPGFTSFGHAVTIMAYTGINCAVCFTNVDLTSMAAIGARMGWLITANLCVLVFLAIRNTPMAWLVGYSYERLNVLHQAAGYTTVILTILHGVLYTVYFMNRSRPEMLVRPSDLSGIVSGFAMLVMLIMPLLLKGKRYEVFYASHVTSFIVVIITAALHQRELAEKVAIMTIVAGGLWSCDRLVRLGRTVFNARGNTAQLYPLPNGGTRVVLKRTPCTAKAGQHCFVWIPAARRFETHPFSIVTTKPNLEFVVSGRDGFTRDLYNLAVKSPGVEFRASMDGPYGAFPDPLSFDRVVLVAGGNGASFIFGVLGSLLGRMGSDHVTEMEFTWTVRERVQLAWYEPHLNAIRNHAHASKVNLTLHITRENRSESPLIEKLSDKQLEAQVSHVESIVNEDKQLEAGIAGAGGPSSPTMETVGRRPTQEGRPQIKILIADAVARARPGQKVLVLACGPTGMIKDVRRSVAANLHAGGPSVELHCEQFGW
jgi:predicted ferric reductase